MTLNTLNAGDHVGNHMTGDNGHRDAWTPGATDVAMAIESLTQEAIDRGPRSELIEWLRDDPVAWDETLGAAALAILVARDEHALVEAQDALRKALGRDAARYVNDWSSETWQIRHARQMEAAS